MGKPSGLSAKQARFVAEYLVDLNAAQAAIRAGYSPKTAESYGPQALRNPQVAAAVAAGKAKQLNQADLTAARVLEELRRIAFCDQRKLFYENGNAKAITELDDETAAALSSWEIIKKNAKAGDGQMDEVLKVRMLDKTKALDTLAKHFGLLKEQVEHSGALVIKWQDEE